MRAAAWLLTLVLLAGGTLAQSVAPWTQQGGDMQRSGVAFLGGATLDVVATGRFLDEGVVIATTGPAGLVETPHGIVHAAYNGSTYECLLVWLDPDTLAVTQRADLGCDAPTEPACETPGSIDCDTAAAVLGYDPVADLLVGWLASVEPVRAWDARTGEERWRAAPMSPTASTVSWSCLTAGLDEGAREVVAGCFTEPGEGVLSSFDLDGGAHRWTTRMPAGSQLPSLPGLTDQPSVGPTVAGVVPEFLTLGADAIVVRGLGLPLDELPRVERASQPIVAWFDRSGALLGDVRLPAEAPADASQWAVVSGAQGALLFGGELKLLNLQNENHASVPMPPGLMANVETAPPVWSAPTLIIPTNGAVTRFDSATLTPTWTWRAPEGSYVFHVLLAPPGDVYVLEAAIDNRAEEPILLHRLEASTGRELQRFSLGNSSRDLGRGGFELQLLPVAGRLLVWQDAGLAHVLSVSDPAARPLASVDTHYPSPGQPFWLQLPHVDGSYQIAWGDGAIETAAPGARLTHQYDVLRPHTIRVTQTRADNTTATQELLMRVGEPEPLRLTALQRAFSPENQELTFFLIGLTLTGGGALLAAALRQRRHARLAKEERVLREVVDKSLLEPTRGLALLEAHRAHLKDAHTRRQLDDAQYGLLDQRTVRAMKSARYRLLGGALNRLSPHFRRLLDTALEDGLVTSGEMAALVASLDHEEALTDAERERLRALLSGWAR